MLQQTQVSRVLHFYPKFLTRYPTLKSLSRAAPTAVRESWEGLGYYRRAENLHRLAQIVVRQHAGSIPGDPRTLAELPGVGRYTAGAIASFAFQRREPAVDTNVARVLGRVFLKDRKSKAGDKDIWALARTLLPRRGRTVWEFNQALMDLGATVCVARTPRCPACPVRRVCKTGGKSHGSSKRALG
jgi:A/G-specific adenine glycosylase